MGDQKHLSRKRKKILRRASENIATPQSTNTMDMGTPGSLFDILPASADTPDQLLQLQRMVGNSATKRLIQRSHGQGCGCAACGVGTATAEQEAPVQRKAADTDAHGAGCRCPSCSSVQRTPDLIQPFRHSLTIQRLMTADAFKKKSKALGPRNKIKPIDKAVAAYTDNSGSMSSEEKVTALQNIVMLCEAYLDHPKRQKSNRRAGVEALKAEAETEITQLKVVEEPNVSLDESTSEPDVSLDESTPEQTLMVATDEPATETTTEPNMSVDPSTEPNQSVAPPTTEPTQSVDPSTSTATSTTTTAPTTTAPEPNMSVESPDENMSIDPSLSDTQQMTPVTGEVSPGAAETGATPKTPEVVDPEKAAATDYFNRLVKGEDIFAATGPTAKSRKDILDLLQKHLTDTEFTQAASLIILSVPGTVVESDKARTVVMSHLEVLFKNKVVARNLLDKNAVIVVVPKNKKMTDLPEFASLAGTQTFDGRNWEDVRGSGGLELNGKIYVAVTEENTLGTDAEGDVSGTQWCYDSGYSTTTHEIAHVIDIHGLTAPDRKKVDDLYKAKKDKQANNEVVEWIDGFDYDKPGTKKEDAQAAFDEWSAVLHAKLTTAGVADEAERNTIIAAAKALMVDGGAYADNAQTQKLKTVGVLSNTADKINKKDGSLFANINATTQKAVYGGKQTTYASSHRLEYFAQSANAFFGTNTGDEPYVSSMWADAGEPANGKRRNGKGEVGRIEPELKTLFEGLFGNKDITDANPRDKVKQEQEAQANVGGGG
jgi:hypothetical protein